MVCDINLQHNEIIDDVILPLCRWLIAHANLFVAWLFNILYSSALVYLSTWTVVNIAPQAAGAGVAEVTAYLNGCNLPKVLLGSAMQMSMSHCPP